VIQQRGNNDLSGVLGDIWPLTTVLMVS